MTLYKIKDKICDKCGNLKIWNENQYVCLSSVYMSHGDLFTTDCKTDLSWDGLKQYLSESNYQGTWARLPE